MTTENIAYGTRVALAVTALQSLAIDTTDPYAGWQSDRVDNETTLKAIDFEVQILLSTAATAPANDKTVYVYLIPWMNNGGTWTPMANFSTTTRPAGAEGTASMSDPNSMKLVAAIPYVITSQPLDAHFTVAAACGGIVPDGWSLALRNNCGAALGTGCVVAYRPITFTNA